MNQREHKSSEVVQQTEAKVSRNSNSRRPHNYKNSTCPKTLFITCSKTGGGAQVYAYNIHVKEFLNQSGFEPLTKEDKRIFFIPNKNLKSLNQIANRFGFENVEVRESLPENWLTSELSLSQSMAAVECLLMRANENFANLTRQIHFARRNLKRKKHISLITDWWNFLDLPPETGRYYARIGKFFLRYETVAIYRFTPTELGLLSALGNIGHFLFNTTKKINIPTLEFIRSRCSSTLKTSSSNDQIQIEVDNLIAEFKASMKSKKDKTDFESDKNNSGNEKNGGADDSEDDSDDSGDDSNPPPTDLFVVKAESLLTSLSEVENHAKTLLKDFSRYENIKSIAEATSKLNVLSLTCDMLGEHIKSIKIKLEEYTA